MEEIIAPISRELLLSELTESRFLRNTRKGNREIYSVNFHNSPHILKEIGRLRELTFRKADGGTGAPFDLDSFDTSKNCYDQLIVWSSEEKEIIGGYRYKLCNEVIGSNPIELSTAHYFNFSNNFVSNYLPKTIELGRSWVQPDFQPSVNPRKGLFSLDNIWDGLGALVQNHPEMKYFFGKVTMYPSYDEKVRNFLLCFMHKYFPDKEKLVSPHNPLDFEKNKNEILEELSGLNFKEGFKVLNSFARKHGEFVPPLVNIYMHLSPTMKTFGTAINPEFGNVEETGILVTLDDIYAEKKERHLIPSAT